MLEVRLMNYVSMPIGVHMDCLSSQTCQAQLGPFGLAPCRLISLHVICRALTRRGLAELGTSENGNERGQAPRFM